jgi:sucrose-6-phosphate hydrolase SacC (GH32 family)
MKKTLMAILMMAAIQQGYAQSPEKTFNVEKKYINIPIEHAQERQRVNFQVDGEVYTFNDIRVANHRVDYWTFVDVSKFSGKKFTLEFSEEVAGIEKIYQADQFKGEEMIYREFLRPQIHFTTRRGWNNDPNGLVYYKGEYHLFYQHNPYEINWGNMTWGHAVSRDLLHWEELPNAIEPDELGTIFSGSAVVDKDNTSGFKTGEENPLVAIYTADMWNAKQQQCIAYSLDRGRTFTKYEGNPVIPAKRRFGSGHERDPKVFWYSPGEHWVLVMHDALNFSIYTSKNLKEWEYQSTVDEGSWECPELFELPVDGELENTKWVMYGVMGTYLIGDFDGKVFTPETDMLRYNTGGMTAAQTYNNEPDGRRLQIGWAHAEYPGMPFKQAFTVVQEFSLRTTADGIRLFIEPVKELDQLHVTSHTFQNETIGLEINEKLAGITSPLLHIKATFEIGNGHMFGFDINGYRIEYHVPANKLNEVFLPLRDKQLELELIVDKTLIEVYADGGRVYWFADHHDSNPEDFSISLIQAINELNQDPVTHVRNLEIHELKSIWE